jgi:hypothetical protein
MLTASLGRESKMENLFSKAIADLYYQTILVSGTSIKTINGTSLLGSGDIGVSGGSGSWGGITGTLSNQTDLQAALDAKASTSAVASGYQPLDADLTAIAALTTTSTGRSLLTESVSPTGSGALVRATSPTLVTPNSFGAHQFYNDLIVGSSGGPRLRNSSGGNCFYANSNYHLVAWNGAVIGWSAASGVGNGATLESGFSRLGSASIALGNGTAGNASGSLTLGQINLGTGTSYITTQSTGLLIYEAPLAGGSPSHYFRENGTAYLQIAGGSLEIQGTRAYAFAPGGASGADIALYRLDANTLELNNRTAGTQRDLNLRALTCANVTASGLLCGGIYTVATLPTASTNSYKFANVSDSSVTTNGSTVAGGGSSKVMVYSNGTNWKVVVG